MIKPHALQKGDTLGIFAPSSRVDRQELEHAAKAIEESGYKVWFHPQTWARHGSFAGTGMEKAQALHDLAQNPQINAILCARGGNGAGQMLPHIDFTLLKNSKKILIGYSDITAILNALTAKTELVTFHGPALHRIGKTGTADQLAQTLNLLCGSNPAPLTQGKILSEGKASGTLIGGNLSVFCSLLGTPWQPDTTGAILFLEDCGDQLSRFDRYFTQLSNAGIFSKISGLVLGDFSIQEDTGTVPFGFSLKERIEAYMEEFTIPVISEAPFGHNGNLYTFPVGAHASLLVGKTIKLEIQGPVVTSNDTGRQPELMPYQSR